MFLFHFFNCISKRLIQYFFKENFVCALFIGYSDEFVNMFRDKTGYRIVEPAHMVKDTLFLFYLVKKNVYFITFLELYVLLRKTWIFFVLEFIFFLISNLRKNLKVIMEVLQLLICCHPVFLFFFLVLNDAFSRGVKHVAHLNLS